MKGTYLITEFRDKDAVKSLGARWDPLRKQWYVPHGIDLTGFASWLPDTGQASAVVESVASSAFGRSSGLSLSPATATSSMDVGFPDVGLGSTVLTVPSKGIPLSQLLGGVSRAVASTYAGGVWTTVELINVRLHSGHVYLEVSERNEQGTVLAKANAVLWASQAQRILPAFEQATGAQLAAGIKLLLRARPVFNAQYGFSLEIDAIDAEYTLSDLEARKRDIRERLKQEGLFDLNRRLPSPWDFNHVLVIAPEGGAGLGDFQVEAGRLQSHGVCQFTYALSRFQGEGAAAEIRDALLVTLAQIELNHPWRPDAVVIIRGGGAVNDMAWLNDYALVRCVCVLDIPVLTGIGHERDSTVLDEVANQRYDTPSKVIAGIERTIVQRTREAQLMFEQVSLQAHRALERARQSVEQTHVAIQSCAHQSLADTRAEAAAMLGEVKLSAAYAVRSASDAIQRDMVEVRHLAHRQIAQAQREAPALLADIRSEAKQVLRTAQVQTEADWRFVVEHTTTELRHHKETVDRVYAETTNRAHQTVNDARKRSQVVGANSKLTTCAN
jgi:exodeoxyribonuclease VII large subunit